MKNLQKFGDFNKISEADTKNTGHFCKWCGDEFTPTKKLAVCCCTDCNNRYNEFMADAENMPFSWTEPTMKKMVESQQIKDLNSLVVGKKYRITWPCYDDFDEGLKPDVDVMEVIAKNRDGYILKHLEHGWTISRHPQMLKDCEIELLEEGLQNEEINFKKIATTAALAGSLAFGNPSHSQEVSPQMSNSPYSKQKPSVALQVQQKGQITSIKELKKMGYKIDYTISDSKSLELELTNIKGIGQNSTGARSQFSANLLLNRINPNLINRGNSGYGFEVSRTLENGNVEIRLVKILKTQNEEISFKKIATTAALAGALANPAHSQNIKKDSIEQASKHKAKITSINGLKKMGYKIDDSIDDLGNLKLELTNIKSIGANPSAARKQFMANVDANGIMSFQLNRGKFGVGFSVTRELHNGDFEFRLVKILK